MSIKLSASALIALGLSRSDAAALQALLMRAGSSDSAPTVAGNSASLASLAATVSALTDAIEDLRADIARLRSLDNFRNRIEQIEDRIA